MLLTNYKALFEHHTDAILVVDKDGWILQGNNAFFALTQFTHDDVQQRKYQTLLQWGRCAEVTTYDQSAYIICKDGHTVPILVQQVMADEYAFIVMKDTRTLDQIAEAYVQSELRYRTIAESIQDVLILMDEHKNYLYVSPSAQAMFHFDYRNLDNRSAFFNIHEEDVTLLEQKFEEAVTDGTAFTVKVKAWHEEKEWVWTELKGQPMYEHGKFQHMLLVARDVSLQHTYEERLLHEAHYDVLTNLPNRRKLNELLEQAKASLQQQQSFAVMVMDIDHFKHVNDYYGHEIGDHVLVEYGKRVGSLMKDVGVVGRYGGDEFMALMPYETLEQLEHMVHTIMQAMERPIEIQQTTLTITTSIGIARIESHTAIRTMIKCADDALYKVKERGRNGFYIAMV